MGSVFLVVLVDLLGFGIILPLLPFFASQFSAGPVAIGFLYAAYSLAQLVFSPLWGSLSDRIGRRPVMILSTLGSSASYLVFVFSHSFGALFLSRLLAGIMGGNIAAAQSYISDVTPPEGRAKGMGLLGAAFGIGFAIGPAIASILLHPRFFGLLQTLGLASAAAWAQKNPYAGPGLVACFLSFTSFLLVLTRLPESLKRSEGPPSSERLSVLSPAFWKEIARENASSPAHLLPLLLGCVFLFSFAQSSLYSSFPLFCQSVLKLSPSRIGMQFAFMGMIAILIQGGLIRLLVKAFGETRLLWVGSVLMTAGFATVPLARSVGWLTGALALMAVGGSLNGPTLFSLVSQEAPAGRTGTTMGLSQSSAGLGRVVGPLWGGALYGMGAGLPFWATSAVLVLAFPAARIIARHKAAAAGS